MKTKSSSELNEIILDVMKKIENKYKNDYHYKAIKTGLKSASTALAEITTEEIEDFKNNDE
jgi:uncharacterized protein (UPF0248 family)